MGNFFRGVSNKLPTTKWLPLTVKVWGVDKSGEFFLERYDKVRPAVENKLDCVVFKSNNTTLSIRSYDIEDKGEINLLHPADNKYYWMKPRLDEKSKTIIAEAGTENLRDELYSAQVEEDAARYERKGDLLERLAPFLIVGVTGLALAFVFWGYSQGQKEVSGGLIEAAKMCSAMLEKCSIPTITPP